jgi:phage-related baseplate assembly protein
MPRYAYPPDGLPGPAAIDVVSEIELLAAIKSRFVALASTLGLDVTGIIDLEGEPANIQLQAVAFRDTLLRSAINDAVKANLLAFAIGSDLDHLATFYDAARLEAEGDDAFRARVLLAIRGRSPAGGEFHYENAARRADPRVADVAVHRRDGGPSLIISVLSTDNGGVADEDLLDAVAAEVNLPSVRVVSDVVGVEAAVRIVTPVNADIWLLPDAPASIVGGLADILDAAMEREGGLGFDVTRSWLMAKLHVPGVQRVNLISPAGDIVVDGSTAVGLGTKTLTFAGRAR